MPVGGLRSFHYNGRHYRLSLRKSLLLLYHDSEMIGAHPGARDTLAKISDVFWWPGMEHEVRRWVATCATCRLIKPTPALTAEQRMELHDRPFRVLFIDAIGPIRPADGEYRYIAHADCPYSRFVWLQPMVDDSEEEWARFLVENVFFDLAGFPAILRSDRGTAFTGGVIKAVNTLLGIQHAFGSSYHPESQGYVEVRHKPVNATLAAYARENPGTWARRCKLAQWAMRATPRADREGRSPFELVTGLKPQGPLQRIFGKMSRETMSPSSYIQDLCQHLKSVHDGVRTFISADYDRKKLKEQGRAVSDWLPQVGDVVLLRRPPPAVQAQQGQAVGEVSWRLTPLADTRPFRVHKQVGPKAYVLACPDTGSTELGFQQPVSLSRLIPFDMAGLETPVNADEELWIDIRSNKTGRDAIWLVRQIVGQQATGNVRLQSLDRQTTEVVDLASYEWRWRNPPRPQGVPARATFAIAKFDPVNSDQNSPYAHPRAGDTQQWRKVFTDFMRCHMRDQVHRVEELLQRYHGHEKSYYDHLIITYEGEAKAQGPHIDIRNSQCRLCHGYGHWGNECPQRRGVETCSLCGASKRGANACATCPPWKRRKEKEGLPAAAVPATRAAAVPFSPPQPAQPAPTEAAAVTAAGTTAAVTAARTTADTATGTGKYQYKVQTAAAARTAAAAAAAAVAQAPNARVAKPSSGATTLLLPGALSPRPTSSAAARATSAPPRALLVPRAQANDPPPWRQVTLTDPRGVRHGWF